MDAGPPIKDVVDSSIPSCDSCRKRKLKCGRQQPTCNNCISYGVHCNYDFDKKKPGLKVGAVESLSRRLELVEAAVLQQRQSPNPTDGSADGLQTKSTDTVDQVNAIQSLARELNDLTKALISNGTRVPHDNDIDTVSMTSDLPRKRRRIQGENDPEPDNPSKETAGLVVDSYFRQIQPWLSIIHEPSFRNQFQTRQLSKHMNIILHAMTVAAFRYIYSDSRSEAISKDSTSGRRVRLHVICTAMDEICVEHVQALLIIIFADVLDGRIREAVSLLGMASHQIELLGIHQENLGSEANDTDRSYHTNVQADWISEEEARRVFWNVRLLERLCTALTRPSSKTDSELSRKLPVCGSLWVTNCKMDTPYLQIHTLSYESMDPTSELNTQSGQANDSQDTCAWKGSLAFFIETVESMGIILAYLHEGVAYDKRDDVARWLNKFRTLDQQLIRWKLQLPLQWADSGISRYVLPGVMDPVMTEANALHNTNVILLHECIAYPRTELCFVPLPSSQSAATCYNAALEVFSTIRKFLQQRKENYVLGPYFGSCIFISARNLLMHSQHNALPLAAEFSQSIEILDNLAHRARAANVQAFGSVDLFSKFAGRLRTLHARVQYNSDYQIDIREPLFRLTEQNRELSKERFWLNRENLADLLEQSRRDVQISELRCLQKPVEEVHGQQNTVSAGSESGEDVSSWNNPKEGQFQNESFSQDDLFAASHALVDPDFASLDRILNFDDILSSGACVGPMGWNPG